MIVNNFWKNFFVKVFQKGDQPADSNSSRAPTSTI